MVIRMFDWINDHRDYAFEVIRVYLGIGLFAKGIYFIAHQNELLAMIETGFKVDFINFALGHYIVMAHLAGGLMLAVGVFTRLSALVQFPILTGAVFFVHLGEGLFTQSQNLEFAILVLFLLGVYSVAGGGRLSVDYYLANMKPEEVPEPKRYAKQFKNKPRPNFPPKVVPMPEGHSKGEWHLPM